MFHCCNMKKIESHFETQSSDAPQINLTFVLHRFVANFVSYICAKYCLNWFSFHIVIMNVIGVNFFLKHSVVVEVAFKAAGYTAKQTQPQDGVRRWREIAIALRTEASISCSEQQLGCHKNLQNVSASTRLAISLLTHRKIAGSRSLAVNCNPNTNVQSS